MPVRKIPRSHRNVTGRVVVDGARSVAFESPLERDFALLTQFTPGFVGIEEQPVRIPLTSGRHYTPDFLVTWQVPQVPDLVEVKPEAKLDTVADKRNVAERFAAAHGWRFRVVTERDIRTPRLANARFLLPFRGRVPDAGYTARLFGLLQASPKPLPLEKMVAIAAPDEERAQLLPTLWHLVSTFRISVDLDHPLTMASMVAPARGGMR